MIKIKDTTQLPIILPAILHRLVSVIAIFSLNIGYIWNTSA